MMTRPMAIVAVLWLFAAVAIGQHPDAAAAYADREKYCQPEDYDQVYYLTLRPYVGEEARDLERAIKLVVASTSRQPIIERCTPIKINDQLLRVDLRDLKWGYEEWTEIVHHRNPYTDKLPLIIRADWLLAELSDMQESDSYHRLLFGGNVPKTRDEILKVFGVGNDPLLTWGMIEGESGVSVQGTRRLESRPIPRAYAWGTNDVLALDTKRDPLEHPEGGSPHDGEEWILGMHKLSLTTGDRGALQTYFLANGQGNIVPRAPVDLVKDHTRFRGVDEIRFPGSCIQCHKTGLNVPTKNAFRDLVKSGVDLYTDYEKKTELEAFHFADLKKEIERANDDYQTIVELVCGCTSTDAAISFKAAIDRYDAPLTLLQTAEESYLTVEQWTKTLSVSPQLPARLASLPHGGTISREAWEEYYVDAQNAVKGQQPIQKKN